MDGLTGLSQLLGGGVCCEGKEQVKHDASGSPHKDSRGMSVCIHPARYLHGWMSVG